MLYCFYIIVVIYIDCNYHSSSGVYYLISAPAFIDFSSLFDFNACFCKNIF